HRLLDQSLTRQSKAAAALGKADHIDSCALVHWQGLMHLELAGSNKLASAAIRNFNDRTHFVRRLAFEVEQFAKDTSATAAELGRQLQLADAAAVYKALEKMFRCQEVLLPSLVKEGLARSHASHLLEDVGGTSKSLAPG